MRPRPVAFVIVIAAACFCQAPALATTVPELSPGDRGGEVAIWQATLDAVFGQRPRLDPPAVRRFLHERGPLREDGVFGPLTETLTRLYQHTAGLPASGRVGSPEWVWWIESRITCCGAGHPMLGEGDSSAYVTWWQISMNRWLSRHAPTVPKLVPDGVFGPLTRRATMRFQSGNGLGVDGIAGPLTWRANRYLHLP